MRFFVVVGMILLLIGFANGLPIHSVSAQEIQPTETSKPSTATEDIDSAEAEEFLIPPRSVDLTTQPQAEPLPPKPTAIDPASVTEPESEPTETSDPSGDEKASPYTDYEQDISPILPVDHDADSEFPLETDRLLDEEDCAPSKRGTRQNHRSGINGEFLYLQARTVDVPYATPVEGAAGNTVPRGPTLFADPDYQPGFRVGFTSNLTKESSISANYWFYQSQTNGSGSLPGGTGYFSPTTMHPNTTSVATEYLSAESSLDIDFDVIDAHYRSPVYDGDLYYLDLTVGARYTRIDQDFHAGYSVLNSADVNTEVGFEGRTSPGTGTRRPFDGRFHLFVRGAASLLLGHVTGEYTQTPPGSLDATAAWMTAVSCRSPNSRSDWAGTAPTATGDSPAATTWHLPQHAVNGPLHPGRPGRTSTRSTTR
ncbi:MAG: hypothetical protein Ct9H300mP1_14500 [Planctomycetaceae bacterium]|nr:MAG: hypothetical protein Ct9H300mP1_14500 [Planctomycetaceae bacterium]